MWQGSDAKARMRQLWDSLWGVSFRDRREVSSQGGTGCIQETGRKARSGCVAFSDGTLAHYA